jgi:C_GCAxxG_C_C family probable redox protein
MDKKEKAIELHNRGFNCAQAVACAFTEEIGVPEEVLFSACEGFGLGMGCMEGTCGAASGAVMLAGFKNSCGDPENPGTKGATYQLSKAILNEFEAKSGALVCKELKGIETGKAICSCPDCIMNAVEAVEKVLEL